MAEATSAETLRRKDMGKLTMTSIYLLQDPQSAAEVELLRGTVTHVMDQAQQAIELYKQKTPQEKFSTEQDAIRSYLTIYEEGLEGMTQQYVNTRILYIPGIVETYLTQSLITDLSPSIDFPRYARECLTAALEICENETKKFMCIFSTSWESVSYNNLVSPTILTIDKGKFKSYLITIALRVFEILQPYLQGMDIFGAVEMAIWLNSHVYYGNAAGDLVSSHSDEEEEDEVNTVIRQTKSSVAGKVNSKIISAIFSRIREILLKDVERFVGKHEDFVPRVPNAQPEFETADDGTNLRLEKALGLGIRAAYPPVKTACRLLVLVHDCTFEYGSENVSSKLLGKFSIILSNF